MNVPRALPGMVVIAVLLAGILVVVAAGSGFETSRLRGRSASAAYRPRHPNDAPARERVIGSIGGDR